MLLDVCVYKDKVILYYQEKIHIGTEGKKNKAVINWPHYRMGIQIIRYMIIRIFNGITMK